MSSDSTPPASSPLEERALQNVRALVERNRQDAGLDVPGPAPRAIRSVGIIGAGMMGTAIAAAEIRHGVPVVITDVDQGALAAAPQKIAAELAGGMPFPEAEELVGRLLTTAADHRRLARCDLVLEAIVEAFAAKNRLFAQLEPELAAAGILASNTSTIPIGRLAAVLAEPTRFCGIHFCHPVQERPLVEIIRGPKTSAATVVSAAAHAKAIGKMPIVVQDGPGFVVNRLLLSFSAEALELLREGVPVAAVEQAAAEFGWAKGPLRLLDEIGLDTTIHGGWVLSEAYPERIAASPLLVAMVKSGRLGRKSGAGFFSYPPPSQAAGPSTPAEAASPAPADEALASIIAEWAGPRQKHTPHTITTRLLLPMVLEATRILEEKKARGPWDIDLAVLFGLGFPCARGGLLWWADTYGPTRLLAMLRPLERLGPRAHPTPLLRDMARADSRFYHPRRG